MTPFPMQPIVVENGVIRFRRNRVVRALLDHAHAGEKFDLNDIAASEDFSDEERCQFYQLIGYSLSGYHEMGFVTNEEAHKVSAAAREQLGLQPGAEVGCRDCGCSIHDNPAR